MLRAVLLVLTAAAVFGQNPPAVPEKAAEEASGKAPADVDAALRARVSQFYQLEVEQKFSQALALVADDTKDLFIAANKPPYHSYQIESITYSDDFTKAEVMALVTRMLPIQGFMGHPLPTKVNSRWKLEKGLWCYYIDPARDIHVSPFRTFEPPGMGAPSPGGSAAPAPPPRRGNIPNTRTLTVDKSGVELKRSTASVAHVEILNPAPWPAVVTFADPKVAGLTLKLQPMNIQAGGKADLSIGWSGEAKVPKLPVTIFLSVKQTNQSIPIRVTFAN
ncbi:MAG TPA: hypothetical protein VMG35_21640 [Bryobacteraceae bacterium]|nr:hypothetical protein [Bryobacteraceae bacterium]